MPKHRSARQMDAAGPLALAVGPQVEDRSSAAGRWILFALFAASGFAGLVYESIWMHYLKLFLGHAAYAQTLVLAIFMGGMALGSWLAARWSGRLRNLLLAYAVTEAAVAAFALVFHEVFASSTGWAHESVLPHFAGFKWVLSTALIMARNGGAIGALDLRSLTIPAVADSLARIGVRGTQDLEVRRVGTRKSWEGLTRSFEVPMNSDYAPLLDQNAARTFFLRVQAGGLTTFQKTLFPALEMLSGVPRSRGITAITPGDTFEPAQRAIEAMYLFDVLRGTTDATRVRLVASDELQQDAASVSEWLRTCGPMPFASLVRVLQRSLSELSLDEAEAIFQSIESGRCAPALSRLEREWFDLLHAVGLRHPAGMEAGARLVLSHQGELSPPAVRYAVAAGMLGAITRGDLAGAREIWSGHGGSIPSSGELLLRMLVERSGGQK